MGRRMFGNALPDWNAAIASQLESIERCRMVRKLSLPVVLFFALAGRVLAHPGHVGHDFQSGWQHPFGGMDHLLAMIAVGLLAVRLGGRALWMIPATFM